MEMKVQHIKILRGEFKTLNAFIPKEKKMPLINDLSFHFKKREKEGQAKYKASRKKKINKIVKTNQKACKQ